MILNQSTRNLGYFLYIYLLIMLFRLISFSRTMFSFLSGVYVYVVAWALLGQDSGDNLGPDNLTDFVVSRITGRVICCLIFPKNKKNKNDFIVMRHSSNYVESLKRRELNKSLQMSLPPFPFLICSH